MSKKLLQVLFIVAACTASSATYAATVFDFAAVADGDNSYGVPGGEYGASSITFTKDGFTVTASGSSTADDDALQYAYLDSTWNHGGGGGEGGLGVCADLDGVECNPSSDDNVTIDETLFLVFDQEVTITGITFRNGEHNPTFASDAVFGLVVDGDDKGNQPLTNLYTDSWTGTVFEFSNINLNDSDPYRFYITNMTVVPVPAAAWLFASGLLGLIGVARRRAS